MAPPRPFLVSVHDVTPAFARETRIIIRDLAALLENRFSFGVVPNWHGQWHLTAYPDYCRLIQESAQELLLHGYFHRRQRGRGGTTWLAEGSDEMNGLDAQATRRILERGQRVFTDVFGGPARGFVAPAWQRGHVRQPHAAACELDHILGFFVMESGAGRRVPLATWTWDCGRVSWLGHVGHGLGWVAHALGRRVPSLAIHPRDLERGYWPNILRLIEELLDAGYHPSSVAGLLESDAEAAA